MKNITVSVSEEVYYAARVKAAENRTTISAIVRDVVEGIAAGKASFELRLEMQNRLTERLHKDRSNGPHFRVSENLTRDELHDRDALR